MEGYNKNGLIKFGIEKGILVNKNFRPFAAIDLKGIRLFSDKTYDG